VSAVTAFGIIVLLAGGVFLFSLIALGLTSVETYDDFWDEDES